MVARGIVRGERSKLFCFSVPQESRKRTTPCRAPPCCDFCFGCVRSVGHSTVRLFSDFFLIYSIYRAQNKFFVKQNFIRYYYIFETKIATTKPEEQQDSEQLTATSACTYHRRVHRRPHRLRSWLASLHSSCAWSSSIY